MSNNRFREIHKSFLKIAKFEYFDRETNYIFVIYRSRALKCLIYNLFMFYEFNIFQTPKNGLNFDNSRKPLIKLRNQNIFSISKMNRTLR